MSLDSSAEQLGKNLSLPSDIIEYKVSPSKNGNKIVEMAEKHFGAIGGLGVAWFMDYFGFGKSKTKENKEKIDKKNNEEESKCKLSKLKDKVIGKKKEKKEKNEPKIDVSKPKKKEIDDKLEVKSSQMTVSEDIELTRQIEAMSANERTMFGIMLAREKFQTGGMHCWDWVDKIYTSVGCERKVLYRNVKNYMGQDCRVAPYAIIESGKVKLPDGQYIKLNPGDHISINNRNKVDKSENRGGGNHSVVFLGWSQDGIAKVVGYTAKTNRSSAYNVNLNNKPIVHISRPVIKKPINLAMLEFHLRKTPAKVKGELPERIV